MRNKKTFAIQETKASRYHSISRREVRTLRSVTTSVTEGSGAAYLYFSGLL